MYRMLPVIGDAKPTRRRTRASNAARRMMLPIVILPSQTPQNINRESVSDANLFVRNTNCFLFSSSASASYARIAPSSCVQSNKRLSKDCTRNNIAFDEDFGLRQGSICSLSPSYQTGNFELHSDRAWKKLTAIHLAYEIRSSCLFGQATRTAPSPSRRRACPCTSHQGAEPCKSTKALESYPD